MSNYRKLIPAVLGALAQIAIMLATAQDAGILPESWRPYAAGVIAIATALGVYAAPPNTPARPEPVADQTFRG